jgi:hypothetical protein
MNVSMYARCVIVSTLVSCVQLKGAKASLISSFFSPSPVVAVALLGPPLDDDAFVRPERQERVQERQSLGGFLLRRRVGRHSDIL